jgi:hypothetical protein
VVSANNGSLSQEPAARFRSPARTHGLAAGELLARFRLFPRSRRPSLGELLGISQASRQVSRRYHLRIVGDPMSPLKNAQRRAKRRSGYYSPPVMFARFLLRLFR